MSTWTDLGLPLPNAKGYSYLRDASLLRNEFKIALPDQNQRNENWRKTVTVNWHLSLEQLNKACLYLLSVGFSWFDIELVTNETPVNEDISLHKVRLTSNYNIKPLGGIYFQLSANVESRVTPVSCTTIVCDTETNFDEPICDYVTETFFIVPTNLYPIEAVDQLTSNATLLNAKIFNGIIDNIASIIRVTGGAVRDTAFVAIDELAPMVMLTDGSVYSKTVTANDSIGSTIVLTGGLVETTLFIVTYTHLGSTEKITSIGTLLSATLE